jgi:hypothetical protein
VYDSRLDDFLSQRIPAGRWRRIER